MNGELLVSLVKAEFASMSGRLGLSDQYPWFQGRLTFQHPPRGKDLRSIKGFQSIICCYLTVSGKPAVRDSMAKVGGNEQGRCDAQGTPVLISVFGCRRSIRLPDARSRRRSGRRAGFVHEAGDLGGDGGVFRRSQLRVLFDQPRRFGPG